MKTAKQRGEGCKEAEKICSQTKVLSQLISKHLQPKETQALCTLAGLCLRHSPGLPSSSPAEVKGLQTALSSERKNVCSTQSQHFPPLSLQISAWLECSYYKELLLLAGERSPEENKLQLHPALWSTTTNIRGQKAEPQLQPRSKAIFMASDRPTDFSVLEENR